MKARLEEAILGTIGARQEMVRRSRGERKVYPNTCPHSAPPTLCTRVPETGAVPACLSGSLFPEVHTLSLYTWHMSFPVHVLTVCTPQVSTSSSDLTGIPCVYLFMVTCVLMFLHMCEHPPVCLREEPIWEPGERTLAEERHTLETNLGPCGQVGEGGT